MLKKRHVAFLMTGIIAVAVVVVYFVSLYADPIVNYYGVRMRKSQLHDVLVAQASTNPTFGLYCQAFPLTNLVEQSICFDSQTELDQFIAPDEKCSLPHDCKAVRLQQSRSERSGDDAHRIAQRELQ